ncbi:MULTISPECIES: hypothetical protein [unclassified Roseofilum]|uniref:hypothetical protein n=1 Tax=unclassified Roseofilum TaxID=2620099 RepID=UPI000E7FBFC2|nr:MULTISPECIES: hypothetical protein [unclassified Roseofilum]MBP0010988.1 hypothetical protein [Roseofilum sp. Belize Diploria]MBP0035492.1 hypothetical protein [Roseofilum sp. Belize BBD 4]HBQ99358.1 hypothetical protein [Cyanobacteria bacterium UBA11691]
MSFLDSSGINLFGEEDLVEKVSRIYSTGFISSDEYHRLESSATSSRLAAEELDMIARLRHAIKRGWVKTTT